MKFKRSLTLLLLGVMTLVASGCSSLGVKPWEKAQFAREEMALDHEKTDLSLDDHIYFSKEGTSGGRSFAGGGCGCN